MFACMYAAACCLLELISLRAIYSPRLQAKNNKNRINKLPHFDISTCAASSKQQKKREKPRVEERGPVTAARNVAAATTTSGKIYFKLKKHKSCFL